MDIEELTKHLKMMFKAINDDELIEDMAEIYWKLYEKLKKKGFTKEEAMQVVTSYAASQNNR